MRVIKTFSIFSFCLMLFSGLAGVLSSASAQQQEKRIALVVGNGAYAKSPLATAANDAGLIAQTLQAAGFDVIGARDLDGDTLRRSFRDFIQKAEASGPDTVAMVYLAGYGMQLAGENYFIPVDSTISRDTDIPTEGMRISDYVRQLASLPLKAGVVVLDAARQQPFIEGGQPLASGLALVEPDRHMLIAFNAAPGTIAPNEQGPYGAYAQRARKCPGTHKRSTPSSCFSIVRRMRPRSRRRIRPPRFATGRCAISVCRMPMPQRSNATPCKGMKISWVPIPTIRLPNGCGQLSLRGVKRLPGFALTGPTRRKLTGRICDAIPAGPMPAMPVVASPFSPPRWSRRRHSRSWITTYRRPRLRKSSTSTGPC